jgi:hypothetical protein
LEKADWQWLRIADSSVVDFTGKDVCREVSEEQGKIGKKEMPDVPLATPWGKV